MQAAKFLIVSVCFLLATEKVSAFGPNSSPFLIKIFNLIKSIQKTTSKPTLPTTTTTPMTTLPRTRKPLAVTITIFCDDYCVRNLHNRKYNPMNCREFGDKQHLCKACRQWKCLSKINPFQ